MKNESGERLSALRRPSGEEKLDKRRSERKRESEEYGQEERMIQHGIIDIPSSGL